MHAKNPIQIILQSQNPRTLTLDPIKTPTFRDLKLTLIPPSTNPDCFYLTLNGKPLNDSTLLRNSTISNLSSLILHSRVFGGGGDGGATGAESRDCYLKMYAEKKPDKIDLNEQKLSKWVNCSLSYEPLAEPCVVDRLGNVFNKQSLVEALLGKKIPKEFGHIKGLKDIINIKLEKERDGERFECPITGLEFNGKYSFFALKGCGHVLSAKALKEVKMKGSTCLVCHEEFKEEDKIVINGTEDEVSMLRERMEDEMRTKVKKPKKLKNGELASNGETSVRGTKRGGSEVDSVEGNGKAVSDGKKFKVENLAPSKADKKVYASLFTSSRKSDFKETYSCRSLPLGRN